MKIKSSLARLASTILALILSGALLRAQPAASTNRTDTNAVMAQGKSSVADTNIASATNFAAIAEAKRNYSLDKARVQARGLKDSHPGEFKWGNGESAPVNPIFGKTIVALAAILSPFILAFGLPAVIIFTVFYFRHRQNKMMHETVRAMIEKGVPVSPEMIAGLYARGSNVTIQGTLGPGMIRNRRLLPGLLFSGVGIGLIIALPEHSGPAGLITLFIGLAFLVAWLVERKQTANDERGGNMAKGVPTTEEKQDNEQQLPKM